MPFRPWRDAWQDALYGPDGFYRRPEGPAGHFRTASHAAPALLAGALATLAAAAGCTRVVDVGAGRGELLTALHAAAPGLDLLGVDVVERPPSLPSGIDWDTAVPASLSSCLLVGWELLDVVPCVVAEADEAGVLREVEVTVDGSERLGGPLEPAGRAWCATWWPGPWATGQRVEVGAPRDEAWAALAGSLGSGLALAVDYDHTRATRPSSGSLAGFSAGRPVPPVPDGSRDLTAHVALDAVAAASSGTVVRQREALRHLGIRAQRPDVRTAAGDPGGYVRALALAGEAAELLDAGGLGGFGWLGCPRGARAERAWSGLVAASS